MDYPLNFLIWNIRGISRKDLLNYLKNVCISNKVQLLVLIEPFTSINHLEATRMRLGFDNASYQLDRKVWLFWFDFL